mgnify:CR=1 FL=1
MDDPLRACNSIKVAKGLINVLILIVMDDPLRVHQQPFAQKQGLMRLNPYCNG